MRKLKLFVPFILSMFLGQMKGNSQTVDLNNPDFFWKTAQPIFLEDFLSKSSYPKVFNSYKTNDYEVGVQDGKYLIRINKPSFFRFKYFGGQVIRNPIPNMAIATRIKIPYEKKCFSNCMGRGLMIRFNKNDNSFYSVTINDIGEIRFSIKYDRKSNFKSIRTEKVEDLIPGKSYKLGVVPVGDRFFVYLEDTLVFSVDEQNLKQGICGIIASGIGDHYFDDIAIYSTQ